MGVSDTEDIGIGPRLKAARERLRWSREALAFHSGISWSAITQVESGRRTNVRPNTLSALANALGVTIDYLVRGGASPPLFQHRALLYDTSEAFLDTAQPFLEQAIGHSGPVLAVTSKANVKLLRKRLGAGATSVDFADRERWLRSPLAALNGFQAYVNEALERGAPWVWILGEPIWEGRSESDVTLWVRFESLINLVFSAAPLSALCPYDASSLAPAVLRHACVTHPHTIGRDGLMPSPDYADPGGFVLDT